MASRIHHPSALDHTARVSIRALDGILGGRRQGVSTKVASGGIPPGMEGLWAEYQRYGYDTQRLFRDQHWRERGVDHSIIGHMWRLLAINRDAPTQLILASGDGKRNEFGTSFLEVIREVLKHPEYDSWGVTLASFDWDKADTGLDSPTSRRMRAVVEDSDRGEFINLMDRYDKLVFHKTP